MKKEQQTCCEKFKTMIGGIVQKHLKNKEKTKENIAKTYRYLIGKGFSYEEASYALKFFIEDV